MSPLLHFPVSILDWGGGDGKNTPFRNQCSILDIYDISNIAVISGARSVTHQVATASKYDLIVCSNVLEHVPYPSDLLRDIKQSMHAGSLLYIEVPYEELVRVHGSDVLQYKKHWHEHINFFSPSSLKRLLNNCGLKTVATNNNGTITAGLKSSFLIQIACTLA